jgi:pimeloyl-ACP methyl ester carboxylesterase
MRRSPINRKAVLIFTLIVVVIALVALLPVVIVGQALPAAPPTPAVAGTKTAQFDQGSIRYQDVGSGGSTVLLLHGFNGHLGQWDQVWQELGDCKCRRIRIDIPGFGDSKWDQDQFGLDDQSKRVIALLDRLKVGKVTLVGASMGGSLSALIAARHPERVDRVVLLAPSGFPGSLTQPGLYGKLAKPGTPNKAATWIAGTPLFSTLYPNSRARQALTVTATYGKRWKDALADIRAPTLIIWSTGDATTDEVAAKPVNAAIAGSALILLDAATGHEIPIARPELAAKSIELMIQGTAPADVAAALPDQLLKSGEGPAGN